MKLFQHSNNVIWRLALSAFCLLIIVEPLYAVSITKTLEAINPLTSSVYAAEKSSAEKVQDYLNEGAKLYREGRWQEAISIWEKALELEPKNKKALRYVQRAKQKLTQGRENTSLPSRTRTTSIAEEKVETKENSAETYLKEGISLYREGDYDAAIKKWNKALAKDPTNEKAKRYIERALKKQAELSPQKTASVKKEFTPQNRPQPKEISQSIEEEKPKKDFKKEAKELLEQGKKLYRQEDYVEAIKKWEKVVQLDPMNLAAKRYIKRAKEKLDKKTSIVQKEEAVKKAPTPIKKETTQIVTLPPKASKIKKETKDILSQDNSSAPIKPVTAPVVAANGKIHDYGTLSLEEIIKLGLSNHGPSKVAREEVKLAKMRLIEARRARYPGVNLKNGITEGVSSDEDFEGLEFTAEFQLPIMTGGRIKNSIRQAEANMAVSVKNYEKVRSDLVAELEQAFYALSNAKKIYRDRLQLYKEAESSLELMRKQFDLGLARQLDLLNVENQFNDISFQVTSAEKDLELAYLTVKQTMDLKEHETYDIQELTSYTIMDINYDETLKLALQRRPDIKLAELQVLFNKYGVKVAEAQDRFRVEMNASVGLNDQFFVESDSLKLETEYFVGIRATKPLGMHTIDNNFIIQDRVPAAGQTTSSQFGSNTMTLQLFNNSAKTGVTESRIQYMRSKGEYKSAIKTTKFEVRQNYFEYQKALAQLEGAITRLKLGEEEVKILKAQAQLNQAQLLDVLRAQVRQYEARGNVSQSVTSYYTAISNLNKAIGITGYYNPVTGDVSETLHVQLFKPINKPRYKVFTQLTKDRMGEDILSLRPEDVTAQTLLAKERKKERAFNEKWAILAPLKVIPGAKDALMPEETREGLLNSIDLPPEKPLKPFKPWQFLRWPMLGLLEYEPILDDPENGNQTNSNQGNKETKRSKAKKKAMKLSRVDSESNPSYDISVPPEINAIKVIEDKQSIQIVLDKKGFMSIASYPMENPARVLCVLQTPAEAGANLKSVDVSSEMIKGVRFKKTDTKVNAFIIDLDSPRTYQIRDDEDHLVVAIEKEAL